MIELKIIGRVGADAEVKNINGRFVMSFSVAHTEKWTDKQGNKQERTTWVSCSQWSDKSPGVAPYIKKGGIVYVSGAPSADAYNNQAGEAKATLRLDAKQIELLGGGTSEGHGGQQAPQPTAPQPSPQNQYAPAAPVVATTAMVEDDDLPF